MDPSRTPTTPDVDVASSEPVAERNAAAARAAVLQTNRRIIVALILLFLLGILPGWLFLWQNGKGGIAGSAPSAGTAAPATTSGQRACAEALKRYENTLLGVGFCYPAAWGGAVMQDARFERADKGSRWRLSFTAKTAVHLGLVSPDWATLVPRGPACDDPAQPALPSFGRASAWRKEGEPTLSAARSVEASGGYYFIEERVDDTRTNGVCLTGYVLLGGAYRHAVAAYAAEFSPVISSPDHHIADPNVLITGPDRAAFAAFVRSIRKL